MGIRTISMALAGAALVGTSAMAAAPVRPSTAPVMFGANLGNVARIGAAKSHKSSDIATTGGIVIGVLAAAAVAGGVAAGVSKGHSSVSP